MIKTCAIERIESYLARKKKTWMKNIIFSQRNLDFKIVNLELFPVILQILTFGRRSGELGEDAPPPPSGRPRPKIRGGHPLFWREILKFSLDFALRNASKHRFCPLKPPQSGLKPQNFPPAAGFPPCCSTLTTPPPPGPLPPNPRSGQSLKIRGGVIL